MDTFSPIAHPGKNTKAIDEHITDIINKYFTKEQASFFNKNDGTNRKHIKTGETPLHIAIRYKQTECVEQLILLGVMIHTKDRIGNKPIHSAAMYGHSDSIEFLLRKKQELVHEINDRKETPLHLAVRYGHCPSAALLIKNGASLQVEDNIRDTPIHTAIQYKQKECLQLLLENGSSVFVLNRTDDSPMAAAQDLQDESLIGILQEYQFQGLFSDMAGLGIETKEEFESMLSSGSYRCYWNRSFLVGAYNVGKTTLAKNLVGDPIPEERRSTDGIWIYLGRAGMDIDEKKWIFVPQGTVLNAAVQSMLISSSQQQESKEKMENLEDSDDTGYDESNAIFLREVYADKNTNRGRKLLPNPVITTGTEVNTRKQFPTPGPSLSETGQTDPNKSDKSDAPVQVSHTVQQISFKEEKFREKILTNDEILNLVLSAVKDGEYKMKLVPIDLWDFGGQKIYYMTHQLFISSRGIFIIIFNGSKEIHKEMSDLSHLPGQSGKKTMAVYLLHWVNSILTYCKTSKAGFPKILFVATHKDLIKKANIIKHKEKLTGSIEKLFEHHTGRKHLQINPLFFVNAKDKNDLEVDELRKAIVEVAFAHPSWGEPMPTVCVPLDLQLMEHAKNGRKIMSLVEIEEVNATNNTMVLTASQLTTFLKLQHALGKYIYFSEGQLNKYVVIDPSYLVEVLKSVVTEEEFWPENEEVRKIYLSLRDEGILRKVDLLTLWGQEEYRHIQAYKDYLINMLIYLDILIEPRSNVLEEAGVEIETQKYYVPCMIKQKAKRPKVKSDSSILLAYAFNEDVIPPAFMYRFLGTSMSMWTIKSIFTDCAIVHVDDCHELILYADGKRLIIELVHKTRKQSIVGTVASTVQECLTRAIIEISKFYWSATDSDFSIDLESTKKTVSEFSCVQIDERTGNQQRIIPYVIEFGVRCSSTLCFFQHNLTTENQNYRWKCPKHKKKHDTKDLRLWFAEKKIQNVNKSYELVCEQSCLGLGELELDQCPSDQHIGRLVFGLNVEVVRQLFINLDMQACQWDGLQYEYTCSEKLKFFALWKWKQKEKNSTFRHLVNALNTVSTDHHKLCEVFRNIEIPSDKLRVTDAALSTTPDRSVLENLSNNIGKENLQLGLELGLKGVELQEIAFKHKTNLMKQTTEILKQWRRSEQPLSVLAKACYRIDQFGAFDKCV